jgi:hypothetical protein
MAIFRAQCRMQLTRTLHKHLLKSSSVQDSVHASTACVHRHMQALQARLAITAAAPANTHTRLVPNHLQIDDETVFPQQFGLPFPTHFHEVVRTICKRLFRVYAHMYHSHFKQVQALGEDAHLNTCFKHFIFFSKVSHGLLQQRSAHQQYNAE